MPGQIVKQAKSVSLLLDRWRTVVDAMFHLGTSQKVNIQFSLVNSTIEPLPSKPYVENASIDAKVSLFGPGRNTEEDAVQTIAFDRSWTYGTAHKNANGHDFLLTRQVVYPQQVDTLTLQPGHYVVTVQLRGNPASLTDQTYQQFRPADFLLRAERATLAVSAT